MRSDQPYYANESRCPQNSSLTQILIDDGLVQICGKRYDIDFFENYQPNLGKYKIASKCMDGVYSLLFNDIKRRRAVRTDGDTPLCDRSMCREEQVALIVGDFFGRSEILSFIDIIINQLRFKAVMVLPISLCLSFDLNQNYCSFVYKSGFSFVDDFALVDTFRNGTVGAKSVKADDEDFAEEFSRLSVVDTRLRYSCDECEQKEESPEKIQAHVAKEHGEGAWYFYEESPEDIQKMNEQFQSRIRYLFGREKREKISRRVFSVGVEFEGTERMPAREDGTHTDHYEIAGRGAQTFSSLDVARDLWMTDHEWRNARLRVLKEKLLFYI